MASHSFISAVIKGKRNLTADCKQKIARGIGLADSLDSGSYMIEVSDGSSSACRIHCTIGNDTKTQKLGTFAVQPYASVIGMIDTMGMPAAQRYLQIYGLNRIVPVESNGLFSIGGLPADLFTFRITTTQDGGGHLNPAGSLLSPLTAPFET